MGRDKEGANGGLFGVGAQVVERKKETWFAAKNAPTRGPVVLPAATPQLGFAQN